MPLLTTSPATQPGLYCRRCGYDLRGNKNPVCCECGGGFDPADPRTYAMRPPRKRKWLKRGLASLSAVIVLLGSAWGWLYWEWRLEQQALAQLKFFFAAPQPSPIGPAWLGQALGPGAFVLDRVRALVSSDYSQVTDQLTLLKNVKWLESLYLARQPISDLTPLAKLTELKHLNVENTQVSNLSPLTKLTNLQILDLSRTTISDLSPLADLTGLKTIYLTACTQISELSPLAKLTGLNKLYLRGTKVSNFAPLTKLTGLQILALSETTISDLSPLANLTGLKDLYLNHTEVSDLSPLVKLTELHKLIVPKETITETQVQELRHALPNCQIERH